MTELTYTVPVVGEADNKAEPKVSTALTEIATVVNGRIGAVNLESSAVTTEKVKEEAVTGKKLGAETVRTLAANKYEAKVERTQNVEYEPSATRPVSVLVTVYVAESKSAILTVGGTNAQEILNNGAGTSRYPLSFITSAGEKWKVESAGALLFSSYKTL
jgi:hypothetical protein